ncbi:MAG: V-type ATPase 116kDa subunit family protein [Candidatus Omnitrophota bacterium]
MKKLTLFVAQKEKERFLFKLRALGALHVKEKYIRPSESLKDVNENKQALEKAQSALSLYASERKEEIQNRHLGYAAILNQAKEITSFYFEAEQLQKDMQDIRNKIEYFTAWGGFDPAGIEELKTQGIFIKLCRVRKKDFRKVKNEQNIYLISEDKLYAYIAVISHDAQEKINYEEVSLPKESFEALQNQLAQYEQRKQRLGEFFKEKAYLLPGIKECALYIKNRYNFLNVSSCAQDEEGFLYMEGFCPVGEIAKVISMAKSQGAGYLIEEIDDTQQAPTLIKMPKWASIIKPVFDFMNITPGYDEYDITPFFLIFFSLFFAMLIADAGYGVLFILITLLLQKKFKKAPKQFFRLSFVLAIATTIWGAVTGAWFGFEKIAQLPFFNALVIGKLNSFVDANQNFMIFICFLIGAVHLTIAHLIAGFRIINSLRALAEAGWILIIWGLFFTAGSLILKFNFPQQAKYMFIVGALLIALFQNPGKNIFKSTLVTLADLPLKIVSAFADIVSYLRLFVIGYASTIMSGIFNEMSFGMAKGSFMAGLFAAFILFFGHLLNVAMGLMAVAVHGIRLNMLEFSGHLGMQWTGRPYEPFRKEIK